jgi:diguanylate cyclase (GGDEF)-like protein
MFAAVALLRKAALLLLSLCFIFGAPAALAASLELRGNLRQLDTLQLPREVAASAGLDASTSTWLSLNDPAVVRRLPPDFILTIDQTRFSALAVVVVGSDGRVRSTTKRADELTANWALGGRLRFPVPIAGTQIQRLYIGFEGLDSLSLMRSVHAAPAPDHARDQQSWLLLMGVFAGMLASAFVYNLFLYLRQRQGFQLWYLAWVSAAFAYGLSWTNLIALADPSLAGPVAVRANNVLVGLTVGLSGLFLLSLLESGALPQRLRRATRIAAVLCFVTGAAAADETLLPVALTDRMLNLAMLASVGLTIVSVFAAWRRGSRVVRIFLLGWAPVIAVFAARSARNFGLLPQSDFVDMATFAAIALESLVFSLAIANRFANLRKERDRARERVRATALEADTLRRAAAADFLTGLGNRALFHPHLQRLVASGSEFTLYFIDVDYLKELNDREGHHVGDAVLRYLGEQLRQLVDERTCVARIGGDEFAIIAEGDPAAQARVERLLSALQGACWDNQGCSGVLSLSIGSVVPEAGDTISDVLRHADLALYEAKHCGRGQHRTFDADLRARTLHHAQLILDAHAGLERGEFLLHFQPIIDLEGARIVSLEALVRWQHPRLGLLTPHAFEGLLSEESIGPAIQERVLGLAIVEMQKPHQQGRTLAVNFTAMDLRGEAAALRLLARLDAAGVSPASLCIEVTEGILLERAANEPIAALHKLHSAGVRIALDDFGTGYASLVHLKMVPVDILKIDQTFVAGLLDDTGENEEIVRAIIALGHGLKKTIVAEGIETVPQLLRLRELGCDLGQGYLFGRPCRRGYELAEDLSALAAVA